MTTCITVYLFLWEIDKESRVTRVWSIIMRLRVDLMYNNCKTKPNTYVGHDPGYKLFLGSVRYLRKHEKIKFIIKIGKRNANIAYANTQLC